MDMVIFLAGIIVGVLVSTTFGMPKKAENLDNLKDRMDKLRQAKGYTYTPEAEKRMDIIAQNGNDGLHYKEQSDEV